MLNRRLLASAAAIALLPLAGCGSDDEGDETDTAPASRNRGIVTDIAPSGPADPAVNLEQQLPSTAPEWEQIDVTCPELPNPPEYPFQCTFTAYDTKEDAKVEGELAVPGVFTGTMTYVIDRVSRLVKDR